MEMLRKYILIIRDGGVEPTPDELASQPAPVMEDVTAALDAVRRLARSYAVVRAAEGMVRLYGDIAAFQGKTLDAVFVNGSKRQLSRAGIECDDITWFVLTNLLRDRELEFVYAYRQELGIGSPTGGPAKFPIEDRATPVGWPFDQPWSNDFAEHLMRSQVLPHHRLATEAPHHGNGAQAASGTRVSVDGDPDEEPGHSR